LVIESGYIALHPAVEHGGGELRLTVNAMPTDGSIFLGWGRDANSQGCGINPSCTFTVTQPAQLDFTATFSTPNGQDLLSVAINGPGLVTSDPVGISCLKRRVLLCSIPA